jgi:hypothetical protein
MAALHVRRWTTTETTTAQSMVPLQLDLCAGAAHRIREGTEAGNWQLHAKGPRQRCRARALVSRSGWRAGRDDEPVRREFFQFSKILVSLICLQSLLLEMQCELMTKSIP